MNQVPETENPATPLRFMHQRPLEALEEIDRVPESLVLPNIDVS